MHLRSIILATPVYRVSSLHRGSLTAANFNSL